MKSQSVAPFRRLFTLLLVAGMALTGCVTAEGESDPEDVDEAEQELGGNVDADVEADSMEHQRSFVDHVVFDAEVFDGVDAEDVGPFEQKAAPGNPGEEREEPDPHPWSDRKSSSDDDDDNPVYAHANAI